MDNLYDILQIDNKTRDIEIKKAYIKMLRKYPPEKCPEEFKKIREAYEILIDPILKAEYNAFINHKDNINEYRKKGNNALDKKQYRRADRKSTRLNSSHANISYAVFCLKKQI